MRRWRPDRICWFALLATVAVLGGGGVRAQDAAGVGGLDPNEIPVPPIVTALGTLPGVNELPVRKELPDVLVMEDGTRVTNVEEWAKVGLR
jgi:hypothetical protein